MSKVTLMEGSWGTQLTLHVGDVVDGDPLWSARFLRSDREICIKAHRDLVRAGTEILTSGSYQASIEGFMKYLNLTREQSIELIKESIYVCKEAIELERKEFGLEREVKVAGSIGAYGAYLHDGSEYTGAYKDSVSKKELKDWHRPRMQALVEAGADLLGFETIPALVEGLALIELLKEFPGMKAWLSFSCKDENSIASGESFEDVALRCWEAGSNQLIAVGVNCMNPKWVTPLFNNLRRTHPEIPLMAYPNSGEHFDKTKRRWLEKDTCKSVTDYTREWLDLGVSFIGGCCRTNHNDVEQFKIEIDNWTKEQNSK